MRPRAVDVKPLDNYLLLITFSNGEKKVFDVKPYLAFPMFSTLKNKQTFDDVHVAGLSIEWGNGQDICPDELYYDSKDY